MQHQGKTQEELAKSFRKQQNSETSLKHSEDYCCYLENGILILNEDSDKPNAKVLELSAQLEVERQKSLRLEGANQELRELFLQCRPQTTAAGYSPFSQNGRWHEERAQKEMGQKQGPGLPFPAASQSRLEETNAKEAMLRKQQEQRTAALTSEMDRTQSTHQARRQIADCGEELDLSEKPFPMDENIRRGLAKISDKPNEMLPVGKDKGLRKTHKETSLLRGQQLGATPRKNRPALHAFTGDRETRPAATSSEMKMKQK
ncbi:uncharacterized protein LOC110396828 [Numida meleagris]|uniref:uncharacterized protein LOC110396828 n=1 Tax=Numida meleagris TaxID=8996 RepID=UPI000B3E39DB|nr:uncharacterized protein LOC110396828 [Numida meleagris]